MRRWILVVFPLTVLAVVGVAAQGPGGGAVPPERIESHKSDRSEPVWVGVESAVREGGTLVPELFAPIERTLLQQQLAHQSTKRRLGLIGDPQDPCRGARGVFAEYAVMHPKVSDLVEHSEVAFSGRVQGGRPGFYRGQPRQLYRVQVDAVWLDSGDLQSGDVVFVAFEEAQIRVGDDWLCVRGPRFPDRPLPGKRMLVFSHHGPWGAEPIFSPMDVELFFETRSSISVPNHLLSELDSPRLADLEDEVAALTAASKVTP